MVAVATTFAVAFAGKPRTVKFEIHNGTNLAHWLSQTDGRWGSAQDFIRESDIRRIAEWGLDHVRIPIDEKEFFNDDGSKNAEYFSLLANALDWCAKYNLRAIVDLHVLRIQYGGTGMEPLFSDPKAQDHYCEMWKALSATLRHYPVKAVAYELLNEPVAENGEDWNKIAMRCYRMLRKLEPRRVIVLGSNKWQSFETMKELEIPQDDPNIILSFHYYIPMALTHYGAEWTDLADYKGAVHYPGQTITDADLAQVGGETAKKYKWWTTQHYDRGKIRQDLMQAVEVARKHNLRLWCGEYGCGYKAPRADRMRWYADVASLFGELGIAYANWNYKSDWFGFVSSSGERIDEELASTIAPKRNTKRQ